MAQAEGLAAGTGLLTGTVAKTAGARTAATSAPTCPSCQREGEIMVVDLVAQATTLRCVSCGRRWTFST